MPLGPGRFPREPTGPAVGRTGGRSAGTRSYGRRQTDMTIVQHRHRLSFAVAVLVAAAAACGGDAGSDRPDTTSTVPGGTTPVETVPGQTVPGQTVPAGPNTEGWPVAAALIDAAVDDLAETDGVDEASIVVVLAEPVTWRDGSLGCPEPDRAYTQALVDGYRIELAVDDATYWYHGSGDGDPFRCDEPREPVPGSSGDH